MPATLPDFGEETATLPDFGEDNLPDFGESGPRFFDRVSRLGAIVGPPERSLAATSPKPQSYEQLAAQGNVFPLAKATQPLAEIIPRATPEEMRAALNPPNVLGGLEVPTLSPYSGHVEMPSPRPPQLSGKALDVATGVEHSVADLYNFFTSPLGIGTLGTGLLPKVAQSAIAAGFAAQMAKDVPDIARQLGEELGKPENERDYKKIAYLTTSAVTQTGFSATAGAHAARPVLEAAGAYPRGNAPGRAEGVSTPVPPEQSSPQPAQQATAQPVTVSADTVKDLIEQLTKGQIRVGEEQRPGQVSAPGKLPDFGGEAPTPPTPEPATVVRAYHFTTEPPFERFDSNKIGSSVGHREPVAGFYLTTNERYSGHIPEGMEHEFRRMDAAVSLKNPLRVEKFDELDMWGNDGDERRQNIEKAGYDGIIAADGDEIIAFHPEQVRFGNTTAAEVSPESVHRQGSGGGAGIKTLSETQSQRADKGTMPALQSADSSSLTGETKAQGEKPVNPLAAEAAPEQPTVAEPQSAIPVEPVKPKEPEALGRQIVDVYGVDMARVKANELEAQARKDFESGLLILAKRGSERAEGIREAIRNAREAETIEQKKARVTAAMEEAERRRAEIEANAQPEPEPTIDDLEAQRAAEAPQPDPMEEALDKATEALQVAREHVQKTKQPSIGSGMKSALEKNEAGEGGFVRIPSREQLLDTWDKLFGSDARQRVKEQWFGTLGTLAGKTLPRITRANREAGEAGANYVSSKIAAGPIGRLFAHNVIGSDIDPAKFGAALSEDNLRSIGDRTFSFVGKKKPFKTEEEYQNYLKQPEVQAAIARHIKQWNQIVEPMYKAAMMHEPDVELPTRGVQTGARVNLFPLQEGSSRGMGFARGNLLNTFRRKSPFGVQAEGNAEWYVDDYNALMSNTFARQLEIANKNRFDDALVKHGLAMVEKPGQQVVIGDEPAVPFPLQRQTIVTEEGAYSKNEMLYVKRSLAREYRNAANVDDNPYHDFIVPRVMSFMNKMALAGLTDATVHITNLTTSLLQLPVSKLHPLADALLSTGARLDAPLALGRAAVKGLPETGHAMLRSKLLRAITPDVVTKAIEDAYWKNQKQLAQLANIGALKSQEPSTGLPLLRQMSNVIQWYDRTVRLVLSDAYRDLAARGVVEKSDTAEREFVNQVGQYNRRAQGAIVRLSRDLGTGPFVTAGRAFNVLGVRAATLSPGVRGTSAYNAGLLRVSMVAKWTGTLAFVALANYLITGKTLGRPGTPLGSIDTGQNDDQGRMKNFSVINLTGQGRALRVTGARGAIEATRKGLDPKTAMDAAGRDVINSWAAPFAGPTVKFATTAASGYPPAIDVGRSSKVVPPGQSQKVENLKEAALDINPIVAGIHKAQEPGKTSAEVWKSQLPRFTMQTTQPEQMIQNYPLIVRHAQANAFTEDVIRRARYMDPEVKAKYLRESLEQLDPADRPHALLTLKFRKVIR